MKENWEVHWKDYYKILQIDPLAEPEVVKAAYDKLARKYHPDVNKDATSIGRMKDLNEAFEIINHPEKRKLYYAAYLQSRARSGNIDTVGTPPHSYQSETKASSRKTPNVVWEDEYCAKCKKTLNMRIAFVDKKPAYAVCPGCNTYWDIRQQASQKPRPYQHHVTEDLPPDVKKRFEDFQNEMDKKHRYL